MIDERKTRWMLGLIGMSAFCLLLGLEIAVEDEISALQVLLEVVELLLTIIAAVGIALLVGRMHAQHEERMALVRDLQLARVEGEGFRAQVQSHLDGLGAEIEKQFQAWSLTSAEREIGVLMLKGFGHQEIAALRRTSEATVRQQARGIYQKSGLEGRRSFCAFFLEGLLPPSTPDANKTIRMTESRQQRSISREQ